jgi:hypothetical protein
VQPVVKPLVVQQALPMHKPPVHSLPEEQEPVVFFGELAGAE